MSSLGWVSEIMLLHGHEYGALTRRKRAWLVCVHCQRCSLSVVAGRNLVKRISTLVGQMVLEPLPAECFMLPDDDPYLLKELPRQGIRQQQDAEDKNTKWQADVVKSLEKHSLTWADLRLREDLANSPSIQASKSINIESLYKTRVGFLRSAKWLSSQHLLFPEIGDHTYSDSNGRRWGTTNEKNKQDQQQQTTTNQSPSIQAMADRQKACLSYTLLLQPDATSIDVGQSHERAMVSTDEIYPTFIPRAALTDTHMRKAT